MTTGHDIRWGLDPNAAGDLARHGWHEAAATVGDPERTTLCGLTVYPTPTDELGYEHRYIARCADCRRIAWSEVNPDLPYPDPTKVADIAHSP